MSKYMYYELSFTEIDNKPEKIGNLIVRIRVRKIFKKLFKQIDKEIELYIIEHKNKKNT